MEFLRLTPENASKYVGYEIIFKSRGCYLVKKILSVTPTSVRIDHPYLHNQVEIKSRKVYVLIQ